MNLIKFVQIFVLLTTVSCVFALSTHNDIVGTYKITKYTTTVGVEESAGDSLIQIGSEQVSIKSGNETIFFKINNVQAWSTIFPEKGNLMLHLVNVNTNEHLKLKIRWNDPSSFIIGRIEGSGENLVVAMTFNVVKISNPN